MYLPSIKAAKSVTDIAKALGVSRSTTLNIRKSYIEEGLLNALSDKAKPGQARIISICIKEKSLYETFSEEKAK